MSDKKNKGPGVAGEARSPAGAGTELADSESGTPLSSEAMVRLGTQWDSFCAHAGRFDVSRHANDHDNLTDELKRIRNTLVILEKPALEFVVKELLSVIDKDCTSHVSDVNVLASLLDSTCRQVGNYLHLLNEDESMSNALSLVPVINDCRACKYDMLLSDSLMLCAGVKLPRPLQIGGHEDVWYEQLKLWIDYSASQRAAFSQGLHQWWREGSHEAITLLIRQLDQFALFTAEHQYLHALTPLFQSASIVARALQLKQLEEGPALQSLYAQLEQNIRVCSLAAAPENLLPADLLRNFLYYAAQTLSGSDAAVELRHRFRLDRVRQVALAAQAPSTPTIGVVYHLTNAIRNGVLLETESLRGWLNSPGDARFTGHGSARLRVRLGQLEPILTLMGDSESVSTLEIIRLQLLSLTTQSLKSGHVQAELSQALSVLDKQLDQSARRSIVRSGAKAVISGDNIDDSIDAATDTCLRKVREELHECAENLMPLLYSNATEADATERVAGLLHRTNADLQALPLPDINALFQKFVELISILLQHDEKLPEKSLTGSIDNAGFSDELSVSDVASAFLFAIDGYLGCVLYLVPSAGQFLADAQEALEHIQGLANQLSVPGSSLDLERMLLSDEGSDLTLNLEDDLFLEPLSDEDHSVLDSTMGLGILEECMVHLDSLDECAIQALKPRAQASARLPNEIMLRSLHSLTVSALSINARDVTAIAQPLQRESLALYREGRDFNAEQTRLIRDLLPLLRMRFEAADEIRDKDNAQQAEKLLGQFLTETQSRSDKTKKTSKPAPNLTISPTVSSLTDVFAEEASLLLDQLGEVTARKTFDTTSLADAFALLHTLKGSARVVGKASVYDCAHDLENDVQQLIGTNEQQLALKQGYQTLRQLLVQVTTRQVLEGASNDDTLAGKQDLAETEAAMDTGGTHELLESAMELTFRQSRVSDELDTLRSSFDELQATSQRVSELQRNGLLMDTSEVAELMADMQASCHAMGGALHSVQLIQGQSVTLGLNVQQSLQRSHLVRVDNLRSRLVQTIDDTAVHCDVSARLQMSGGELLIEKRVYRQLSAPLEHLVRNAVVHGIASPEARRRRRNSEPGVVFLDISMDATDLVLHVRDNGCGISANVMHTLRAELGDVPSPGNSEIQDLLFRTGFSSLENADVVAGHGLGLSAVKTLVEKIGGQIHLDASGPQGLCISLRIPQTLVVDQLIVVKSDDTLYGIPVARVRSVHLAKENVADGRPGHLPKDRPALSLRSLLGKAGTEHAYSPEFSTNPAKPCLWVEVGGESYSIQVDNVIGYRELRIHDLGSQLNSLNRYSSGSVLASGEPVLILDLSVLTRAPEATQRVVEQRRSMNFQPTALVVDHSFTARQRIESLLSSRGLVVRNCQGSRDALECIEQQTPQFLVVDVEMPRMDGFTVIRRIKDVLGDRVPPLIVTSNRDDKVIREMARLLGAVVFLTKPYSDAQLHTGVEAAGLRLPDLTIA